MPLLMLGVAVVPKSRRFLEQFVVVMQLASVDAYLDPPIAMIRAKRQVMWHFLAWMALLTLMPLMPMLISFISGDTVLALLETTVVLRPGLLARSTAWTRCASTLSPTRSRRDLPPP